jgi:hypothetical protein
VRRSLGHRGGFRLVWRRNHLFGIDNSSRATEDSNLWPSAPEIHGNGQAAGPIAALGGTPGRTLREKAEQYLRAVAGRNRFAHRYGIELAEGILDLIADAGASDSQPVVADAAGGLGR